MRPRRIRPAIVGLTLILLTGCGASARGPSPAGPSGSVLTHTSAPAAFTISGQAATSAGTAVQGVLIGFRSTTASASCSACGLITATTDSAGRYTLRLPAGTYAAACAAAGETCEFATSPPSAKLTVTITRSASLNVLVSGTSNPSPTPAPAAPSQPASQGGQGDVVSGHIMTSGGQPVPNADITFRQASCGNCLYQPHTETGPDGSYSITLQPGVYNAECDVIGTCVAQGADNTGGGVPVNIPPGGTLNFIVCQADVPAPECPQE